MLVTEANTWKRKTCTEKRTMGNPVILGISSDQISVFIFKGSYDLRSSPSSEGFWHRRDILLEPRTITQSDFLTWSSYHRGTLGDISRVFHMSILGSINSVDLRTVPKQCTTWLHLSQHRVCRIKTFLLPEKIKKKVTTATITLLYSTLDKITQFWLVESSTINPKLYSVGVPIKFPWKGRVNGKFKFWLYFYQIKSCLQISCSTMHENTKKTGEIIFSVTPVSYTHLTLPTKLEV